MRWLVAAVAAVVLAAAPAQSQDGGPRTLIDMTVWLVPRTAPGHCIQMEAGTVTTTLQLVGDHTWTVYFTFTPPVQYRVNSNLTVADGQPRTYSTAVDDGLYCYSLYNNAVPIDRPIPEDAQPYTQLVAIKMVWSPPS